MTNIASTLDYAQVNLLNAALLPRREVFSTRSMLISIVIAGVALSALAWWATQQTAKLRTRASQEAAEAAKKEASLIASMSGETDAVPTPQQIAALEVNLKQKQALLELRRGVRDTARRGTADASRGPSAVLRATAATIPASAWLNELQVNGARIDFAGKTMDPASVHAWIEKLAAADVVATRPAPLVKIERLAARTSLTTPNASEPLLKDGLYSFVVNAQLSRPFAEADGGGRKP